jgi:hypothetical protein
VPQRGPKVPIMDPRGAVLGAFARGVAGGEGRAPVVAVLLCRREHTELIGQRPVLETLEIVESHFRSIVPEYEL